MKRAVLVLMIVVFALVTVVPAFAMPQDFHGIGVPQVVDPNDGVILDNTIVLEDGVIIDFASIIAVRKAGGTQQDF